MGLFQCDHINRAIASTVIILSDSTEMSMEMTVAN
jgi:hypothetical protein